MSARYGVATISRPLKITGVFCRISSLLQGSFEKETYNFKEPTTRSHPIRIYHLRSDVIYGVATISRLLKIHRSVLQNIVSFIGLFCKRDL